LTFAAILHRVIFAPGLHVREHDFRAWLENEYVGRAGNRLNPRDRSSRLSLARRIEDYEGNLDASYERDRMVQLLERLTYSQPDDRLGKQPKTNIPLPANAYKMLADLRHVATLYRQFRDQVDIGVAPAQPAGPTRHDRVSGHHDWPVWDLPSEANLLALAHVVTHFVRFLHPDIVLGIVEDNSRYDREWQESLRGRGIDPRTYLWERSATTFPGVRRHAGGAEIALFRQGLRADPNEIKGALLLDDNTYPKHLWSFVFRGRPFQKQGPIDYHLAHLVDHKLHKNRWVEELVGPVEEIQGIAGRHGLFTSAANMVYVPATFLRPTDFSWVLRNLFQRRAAELYGGFCQLLPGHLAFRDAVSREWETAAFKWTEVGTTANLGAFLDFRRRECENLFARTHP
jgi:hypothetical protein